MADYYDLLNVSRDANPETLKRAYRRLARQYHPDVNKEPGAEERFKERGWQLTQGTACLLHS